MGSLGTHRYTDREVTVNRSDIIIKKQKRENMHTDRCVDTHRQKCCAKGSGKEVKIHEFMFRDTLHVEHKMQDYASNNWNHWKCNKCFKLNLEAVPGKHWIDSLQKTAILGTAHIIRKVLKCEA